MTHDDIERLLPWYLNETLPARDEAAVERELASCARCAAAAGELRGLRGALLDIEADAPQPDRNAAFAAIVRRLDDERAAGEKRARKSPRSEPFGALRSWYASGRVRAGMALAACLALFFVFAPMRRAAQGPDIPLGNTHHAERLQSAMSAPAPQTDVAAPEAATRSSFAGADAKSASVAGSVSASRDAGSRLARQLARNGTIGLLVADVPSAIAAGERVASANFGVVTGLQDDAPASPSAKHVADLALSVPDDRFSATMAGLAGLGGVTARSVTTEDLTDSIVDTNARLRNLRREESDLLRIMDRSGKVADVLEVEQQLASTREEIERLDAEAQSMHRRVAYATIAVHLTDDKTASVATPGAWSQIGAAWLAAQHRVGGFTLALVARLLLLIAFAPYLLALAGAIAAAAYVARRRRDADRR